MIPEKKYTKIYEHSDTTPKAAPIAVAYTIHEITWKIINDPFLQDYILCTNKAANDRMRRCSAGISEFERFLFFMESHYLPII